MTAESPAAFRARMFTSGIASAIVLVVLVIVGGIIAAIVSTERIETARQMAADNIRSAQFHLAELTDLQHFATTDQQFYVDSLAGGLLEQKSLPPQLYGRWLALHQRDLRFNYQRLVAGYDFNPAELRAAEHMISVDMSTLDEQGFPTDTIMGISADAIDSIFEAATDHQASRTVLAMRAGNCPDSSAVHSDFGISTEPKNFDPAYVAKYNKWLTKLATNTAEIARLMKRCDYFQPPAIITP